MDLEDVFPKHTLARKLWRKLLALWDAEEQTQLSLAAHTHFWGIDLSLSTGHIRTWPVSVN